MIVVVVVVVYVVGSSRFNSSRLRLSVQTEPCLSCTDRIWLFYV